MEMYILVVFGVLLYFLNEWANIKYINNIIQQTKIELKQEINKTQIQTKNGTKI